MKNYIWVGAIVACLLTASVNAQEATWNDAQKEVWGLVQQSWMDALPRMASGQLSIFTIATSHGATEVQHPDTRMQWLLGVGLAMKTIKR